MLRSTLVAVAVSAACQLALANTSYEISLPTDDPYTKINGSAGYGTFTDTASFSLDQSYTGLVWFLPRSGGLNFLLDNITNPSLTVTNATTSQTWVGEAYETAVGKVSMFNLQALALDLAGFDVNDSLIVTGTFTAGDYTALLSGKATGLFGGTYVAKFSFVPSIPEPATSAMMLLGLAGIGAIASRRRAH